MSSMTQRHPPLDAIPDEKNGGDVSGSVDAIEEGIVRAADGDGELLLAGVRQHAERRLVSRLDLRLLPTIVLIFILNYIDVSPR